MAVVLPASAMKLTSSSTGVALAIGETDMVEIDLAAPDLEAAAASLRIALMRLESRIS